jgi:hypothetical protein
MRERNSANAQTRVELKTARWRPRREIDEYAATGPYPVPWQVSLHAGQDRIVLRTPVTATYLQQAPPCTLTG